MNKLFFCFAFCVLGTQAMDQDPILDTLTSENILAGTFRGLFDGPCESDSESKASIPAASGRISPKVEASNPQTRSTISLNEAIMLGKFKANDDGIEYEDFESTPEIRKTPYTLSFKDLNSHIYSSATSTKVIKNNFPAISKKIIKKAPSTLTEEELLNFQTPFITAFLSSLDICQARKSLSSEIRMDDDLSRVARNEKLENLELVTMIVSRNRSCYFAAIASCNPTAINLHKTEVLHLKPAQPLLEKIKELHTKANQGPRVSVSECMQF